MAGQTPDSASGGARSSFQSTLWSVVIRAKDLESPERRAALEKLFQTYWKPLYFFIRRKGKSVDDSEDLIQGFFAEVLSKNHLKYVDRARGKFRTFLLTCLEHYLADEYDRARAQKRGGDRIHLPLDVRQAEREASLQPKSDETPGRIFEREWAVNVLAQAMAALKAAFEGSGRGSEFALFKAHLMSARPQGASYEEMAKTLGVSADDIRNRIRSTRLQLREAILDVIRDYSDSEKDAQEELMLLLKSFS